MTTPETTTTTLTPDEFINAAYEKLKALPRFRIRDEQVALSRKICHALINDQHYAAEAPTGTGKTVAYLVGALAASSVLSKKIVVATATVGLQEQILAKDLPELLGKAGLIKGNDYLVAKGRGRYFCPKMADRFLDSVSAADAQSDLFVQEDLPKAHLDVSLVPQVEKLRHIWAEEVWGGDCDSLPTETPKCWPIVAASSETCISSKCEYFEKCPFFQDRQRLSYVKVIVANHDIVLLDLIQTVEEKESLLHLKDYLLIVDEAHHLPDKAIAQSQASVSLTHAMDWLRQAADVGNSLFKLPRIAKYLDKRGITSVDFSPASALSTIQVLLNEVCLPRYVYEEGGNCRLPEGLVPDNLKTKANQLLQQVFDIQEALAMALMELKKKTGENIKTNAVLETSVLLDAVRLNSRLRDFTKGLCEFVSDSKRARWVHQYVPEDPSKLKKVALCSSPLDGVELLGRILWNNRNVRASFVSATLKGTGDFEPFHSSAGAPEDIEYEAFPYVLPYHKSTLTIPRMKSSPKDKEYVDELIALLPQYIDNKEGSLLLFSSKAMMRQVLVGLKKVYDSDFLLAQTEWASTKNMIATHMRRIDEGKGSLLIGLQKMSEGIDLPGEYCTHVMTTRLPFAVPVDPVEQERELMLGKDHYFGKHALPLAIRKLVQMVGRLVRTDRDQGRITMFDNRITTTRYGEQMLSALPPFTRTNEET